MKKIPLHMAEKLLLLSEGGTLPASQLKHPLTEEWVREGILLRTGRIQKKIQTGNATAFLAFLKNKYGIADLKKYIETFQKEEILRSELVEAAADSKLRTVRSFKGFLINAYQPVKAVLKGREIILDFTEGIFRFVYDFEDFIPDPDLTIVGMENPENFRYLLEQRHLFAGIRPLFVSRYPQNQNKDLIQWLQQIPNPYLHFGDFDLAGIGIYLNEFKKHLGTKATFFIPENIRQIFKKYGNRQLYDRQKMNFNPDSIVEPRLQELLQLIHQTRKGVEQEGLIGEVLKSLEDQ